MLWIRARDGENDVWSYFALDGEEWALRQVDPQGSQRQPVAAASLAEAIVIRDRGDLAAMVAHDCVNRTPQSTGAALLCRYGRVC